MTCFRVATYNVHKCKGVDWRVSPRRIADVIFEIEADIVAAQEILYSQAEAISSHVALPFVFGAARQHAREPYGNAVFTRFPVISSGNYDLTVRAREPRQCLRVSVLLADANPLHFFAVHLGTSFLERREQARRFVSAEILEHPDLKGARVVAGDFNEWTRGLATQMLSRTLTERRHRSAPEAQNDLPRRASVHASRSHLLRSRLSLASHASAPYQARSPCLGSLAAPCGFRFPLD